MFGDRRAGQELLHQLEQRHHRHRLKVVAHQPLHARLAVSIP
jgi:hypothetical protein